MFCDMCGEEITEEDLFCPNCGNSIYGDSPNRPLGDKFSDSVDNTKKYAESTLTSVGGEDFAKKASSKIGVFVSDFGLDKAVNDVSNTMNDYSYRKEAKKSLKEIKTKASVEEEVRNKKPKGALYYVNGRDAELSIFEDYIELNFTGNLLKKYISRWGGIKKIYYYQINGLQKRDASNVLNGSIEFEVPGMSQARKLTRSENVVHYEKKWQNEIDRIYDYVNQKILDINNAKLGRTQSVQQEVNPMVKLKEAKELLDMGVLTQEEFDEIKAKCLEQM